MIIGRWRLLAVDGKRREYEVTIQDITQAIVVVTAASDFPESEKVIMEKSLCDLFDKFAGLS